MTKPYPARIVRLAPDKTYGVAITHTPGGRKLTQPKIIGHPLMLDEGIVGQPIAKIGQALGWARAYARGFVPADVVESLTIFGEQWRVQRRR